MERPDWDYIKGCFSLTPKERRMILAVVAILAVGAAVKQWRESRPVAPAAEKTAQLR